MFKKEQVSVERAGYADIPSIQQMARDAFEHDPLYTYLRNTPDTTLSVNSSQDRDPLYRRLLTYLELSYYVHYQGVFTVNHGGAYMTINRPGPGWTQRVVGWIVGTFIRAIVERTDTPEQRKRWKELSDKVDVATNDAFGDDLRKMLRVVDLATAPKNQGKGYGTALMVSANAEADKIGCASWLVSSNVVNTPFYESIGFVAVKEVLLGENNPTWGPPPIRILIMTRGARNHTCIPGEKWRRSDPV